MDTARRAGWPQGLVITLTAVLPMMAIVTLMPIVPALVRHFEGMANIQTLAPLVLSAPGLCVALFSPFAGALADRIGRRKLMIVFTALYGIGGVLPFFISSYVPLITGRLLLGIGEAFLMTVGNTLLGDYFEKQERAKWLMAQSLLGPLVGVVLLAGSGRLSMIQWNLPFLIYGIALLIAVFGYFTLFEPARSQVPGAGQKAAVADTAFPRALMIRIYLTTFCLSTLYFVYTLQFALALDEMGIKDGGDVGLISALASVAVMVGAVVYKFLSGRSTVLQFTVLFAMLGIGLIGIGMNLGLKATIAFAFLQQTGSGMTIPVLLGWGLRELPQQYRGRGMGWWGSAFFLGQFVSPLMVSVVRGVTGGLLGAFIACGAACVLIAVGNAVISRRALVQSAAAPG